jgi:hypothetical protein
LDAARSGAESDGVRRRSHEMPSPIVPIVPGIQIWQLRAIWSYSGFALSESSWSFADLEDPADDGSHLYDLWLDFLEPQFLSTRPDSWALAEVRVEDRYPGVKVPYIVDYAPPLNPDSSGKGMPPQLSSVISWRTGVPGRSYRGRTFWGPPRVSDTDSDGFVGSPTRDSMDAFAVNLVTIFNGGVPTLYPKFVIVSRQHDNAPSSPPVFTVPEYWIVNRYVNTIRRRYGVWHE